MIYIDPPYGIKFGSNWQVSARTREVKDGKLDDVARESEQIKAFRDTWELGIHSYLSYLRDRVQVSRDLLTDSGSIFVQIGDENVHLVRNVLDEVFGSENFISLISFVTTSGFTETTALPRTGDYLLWFARSADTLKARPLWSEAVDRQGYRWLLLRDGTHRGMTAREVDRSDPIPEGARVYTPDNIQSQGAASAPQPFQFEGQTYLPGANSHWKANYPDGMQRLAAAGRIHVAKNSIRYRRMLTDFPYQTRTNLWTDTGTGNFTDDKIYIVQTNTKVIERCILMATEPGDLVLDPTCGSGTTAFACEQWGRRWITVDSSRVALALARQRLMGSRFPYYLLADSAEGREVESAQSVTPLPPATPTHDIRQGFVYKRVQRITLKSIANNPDIKEGMSPEEIDDAIERHADYELLYDRPHEDGRRVRVTGPFTVESLSPHRSLAGFDPSESVAEVKAADDVDAPTFEQTILDNLRAAGIQNGKRAERLTFDLVEPYAANYIQAVGVREEAPEGAPKRVGVSIGPQYGTVAPSYVKDAAREAGKATDLDLLCILGFAFDPQVLNATDGYVATDESFDVAAERALGRIPVLLVRMNSDLLMGEELKKTGAGNLFTVFGEPDIEVIVDGDSVTVELHGVDVYDPTTGEVRSSGTDQVALWMIDTDYDGESFFVRHCYFTGGQDPYKRLKTALRADIDAESWASLYRTESRPFEVPETSRIAVKVINDYGDEVVKVYPVP
jgi:adenine-specific DNA-methyltransferase